MKKTDRYNKILLVDKPAGMTSHDVIDQLRRILKQRRIGHTGTLDKAATGLMLVCLGRATKSAQFISDQNKVYEAEITLGRVSETYDTEGVDFDQPASDIPQLTNDELTELLEQFSGDIIQQVPAYSAIHVDGRRLYQYARSGQTVECPTREIHIENIKLLNNELPKIKIRVDCSKGTYIRTLAHDIGQVIGCGAYLSGLRRSRIGSLELDDALTLDKIAEYQDNNTLEKYFKNYNQVIEFSKICLNDESHQAILFGKDINNEYLINTDGLFDVGDKVSITDQSGNILAIGQAEVSHEMISRVDSEQKLFSYVRVLN